MQFSNDVAERLKQVRGSLGLTQKQIADKVGAKLPSWKDNEACKTIPGGKVLAGLSRLGVNVNWVLTGEGPMCKGDVAESNASKPMDYDLVQTVVEAVEEILIEADRELAPAKKGQLICAVLDLYSDLYGESDTKPEKEKVLRLVKLAA